MKSFLAGVLKKIGISILLIIVYSFFIIRLVPIVYMQSNVVGFQILFNPFEQVFGLLYSGKNWAALGCILVYILFIYFSIQVVEILFRKMQISLRKGIIIGSLILIVILAYFVYGVLRVSGDVKKAETFIEYLYPKIRNEDRFKDIEMSAEGYGKLAIYGTVKNESDLSDLTEVVFSSNPPVEVEWYMRYFPDKIIWDHELIEYKLKWKQKMNKSR